MRNSMMKYGRIALMTLGTCLTLPFAHAAGSGNPFPEGLVEKGRYLATASDCIACHTAPKGAPMAGGLSIASPVGEIVSTNITPSKQFGIGNYTRQQFADALRKGIRADGANLYPAMPYTSYAKLTDADVDALYAYFMQGVAPVDKPVAQTNLPFPMNIRLSMKFWNALFLDDKPFVDTPGQSLEWNRGRYLVEGAAHCSTCHTPRGFLMQEKPGLSLAGAQVGPWYAPNVTPDKVSGIGRWSQDELVTYLKTGRIEGKAQAAGSMAEAISHSFQHLNDSDVRAMATYVMSLPPVRVASEDNGAADASRFAQGQAGDELAGFRGKGFKAGMEGPLRGAQIYSANCASCHGADGQGTKDGYYPSLFHNSATAGAKPINLVATILYGVDRETHAGGHVFMPPFGDQPNALNALSDQDIADLANYISAHYGNGAAQVKPADVAEIRQGGPRSPLLLLAQLGVAFGAAVVLILFALWLRRKWRPRYTGKR